MLYEDSIKQEVLGTLENRVSSITDCMVALINEGYVPNKNKTIILNWSSILLHAYQNIDVLSEEQHIAIDNIFNKVINL